MKKWLILHLFVLLICGCSHNDWTESNTFTSEGITMIGVENKLAFIYDDQLPIIAGDTNKYIWLFWSDKEDYLGQFEVIAHHQTNGKSITVFSSQNTPIPQPLNGANHHLPAIMTFPDFGLWKIDVTFDSVLFGSVYVDVLDKSFSTISPQPFDLAFNSK